MYKKHPLLGKYSKYVSFLSLLLYTGASRWGHTTPRGRKAGKLSVGGKSEKGSQIKGRVCLPSLLPPMIQVMETKGTGKSPGSPLWWLLEVFLSEGEGQGESSGRVLISSADLFSSFTCDQRCLMNKGLLLKLSMDPSGQNVYLMRTAKRKKQSVAMTREGLQEVGGGSHEDW